MDHKKVGVGRKGINTGEGYIKINILKTVIGKNNKVHKGCVHMNLRKRCMRSYKSFSTKSSLHI